MLVELWRRRVPHIVGVYVAATWMMVEIGDWLSARFSVPEDLTAYVFIALITLLPTVVILAWGHGAPGKDHWTAFQRSFVSINLVAAISLSYLLVQPGPAVVLAATQTKVLIDEEGQPQSFEIPIEGFHRRIETFFWRSQSLPEEDRWMRYGLPWMLAEELTRDPLITARTPFASEEVVERLRKTGFETALGEPVSLQRQIAAERNAGAFISGTIERQGDSYVLAAHLIRVHDGALLLQVETAGQDLFELVDDLANRLRTALDLPPTTDLAEASGHISDHISTSLPAIRAAMDGLQAIELHNDYPNGLDHLQRATEIDPTFATAHALAAINRRVSGDAAGAVTAVDEAMAHSYKLDRETTFRIKALRYQMRNDITTAVKVIRTWTEVEPDSVIAHDTLARAYLTLGTDLEAAITALEHVLELSPHRTDAYLNLVQAHRQLGRFEQAKNILYQLVEVKPEEPLAHQSLGQILFHQGELDAAGEAYERALIFGAEPLSAELALVRIAVNKGHFVEADEKYQRLEAAAQTPRERAQVLMEWQKLMMFEGRFDQAIAISRRADKLAASYMPPAARVLSFGNMIASFQASVGRFEQARHTLDELAAQMQPPFDRYVDFGYLSVYRLAHDQAGYEAVLERFVSFHRQTPNPIFDPLVLWYQALLAAWKGDHVTGSALFEESIEGLNRSILSLQDPFIVQSVQIYWAGSLRESQQFQQAHQVINQVLRQFPAHGAAHLEHARVYLDEEKPEQAAQALARALEIWQQADEDYVDLISARQLLEQINPRNS